MTLPIPGRPPTFESLNLQGQVDHLYKIVDVIARNTQTLAGRSITARNIAVGSILTTNLSPGGTYAFGPGSETLPSVTFQGDIDTGLYWISNGQIGFTIDGNTELEFNTDGLKLNDMGDGSVLFTDSAGQVSQNNTDFNWDDNASILSVADLTINSMTLGSVLFAGTAGAVTQDNSNLFFNNTNNRLGIGTNSPTRTLQAAKIGEPQFRIDATGGYYVDLECDGSADLYVTNAAGLGQQFVLQGGTAATDYRIRVNNTNTTDPGSGAGFYAQVADPAAGDPFLVFDIFGGVSWSIYADNSDSDKFKITSTTGGITKGLFITSGIYTTFNPAVASSGTSYAVDISGAINTGGSNGLFRVLAAASIGQTATTEVNFARFDFSATTTWAAGSINNERAFYIAAPTLAIAAGGTITNASTFYIDRAPQSTVLTNITNSYAMWIGGGRHFLADGTTSVASAAGATWNSVLFDMDVSVTGSTNITTATGFNMVVLNAPTVTDAGTMGTITNSATLYIGGAPTGSGLTITNAYALWVDDGAVRIDGALSAASFTVSGLTATRVTFATTGGALTDDSQFTWDNTNKALTVGAADAYGGPTRIHNYGVTNTFVGYNAGNFTLTAVEAVSGFSNTGIGVSALSSITTGYNNAAVGYSLPNLTIGHNNAAVGDNSLEAAIDCNYCTAMGNNALFLATSADYCSAFGEEALYNCTGDNNTAVGRLSLSGVTSGVGNVGVGIPAGAAVGILTTGSYCVLIGFGADVSVNSINNAIAIGKNATVGASNTMVLGGTSTDAVSVVVNGTTAARRLEVIDTTIQQRLTYTAGSVYTDLETTSGGYYKILPSGNRVGIFGAPTYDFDIVRSASGAQIVASLRNSSNTASARATMLIEVGGTSADDPDLLFNTNGGAVWTVGIDNSDSDSFKVSQASVLGTNDSLIIATGGLVTTGVGGFIGNEAGADVDFRWESDDEPYCLMVEGTLNNVVMCATTEPGFNSMDGGVFLAEANVVPTGNPTAGVYIYVEGGALKCRGTGGTITTMGPA